MIALLYLGVDFSVSAASSSPPKQLSSATTASTISSKEEDPHNDVYVIVSHPDNALSVEVCKQLRPARIYWMTVCSPKEMHSKKMRRTLDKLQKKNLLRCYTLLNAYGTTQQLRESAMECWEKLQNDLVSLKDANGSAIKPFRLCGVLFNQYGYSDEARDGTSTSSSISPLAQYKLLSTAVLTDSLTEIAGRQQRATASSPTPLEFSNKMCVIVVGTEAARGLPKMGFPVPKIECHEGAIQEIFRGSSTTATQSSWEREYADLNAVLVLYVKALAAMNATKPLEAHPHWYFGVVSPGMTQESLQVKHVPPQARTLYFRLKMFLCRYLFFGLLRRLESVKTVKEGGKLLARALRVRDYDDPSFDTMYPSGAFVGAKSGTGGALCEQTELEGGKFLHDPQLQQLVYEVVQKNIMQ